MSGSNKRVVPNPRHKEQFQLLEYYVKHKAGATDLFESLDLNYDEKVSVQEIQYFLDSLDDQHDDIINQLSPLSLQTLLELGEDHEMSLPEFEMWLSLATRGAGDGTISTVTARGASLAAILWNRWLATGTNADELFHAIDTNHSDSISVPEIEAFLTSIQHRGLDAEDVEELVALGRDHQLSLNEFTVWLAGATEPQYHARDDARGYTPTGGGDQ